MSKKLLVAINEHGRPIGEAHHMAKLSDGDVDLILALREEGWSYGRLARTFEISKSAVFKIVKGERRCQCAFRYKVVHLSE